MTDHNVFCIPNSLSLQGSQKSFKLVTLVRKKLSFVRFMIIFISCLQI